MSGRNWMVLGGLIAAIGVTAVLLRSRAPDVTLDVGAPAIEVAEAGETMARSAQERYLPRFTDDGRLIRPEGWEAWVLAGTSITHKKQPRTSVPGDAPGKFLNVYLQPWAYDSFMEDGAFPEGTVFVTAGSVPVGKPDPARGGFYQGDLQLMAVHLKQQGIDPTGWAFYGFGADTRSAEKIPGDASCYTCHAEKADHDNAFVHSYPRMRERLGLPDPLAAE